MIKEISGYLESGVDKTAPHALYHTLYQPENTTMRAALLILHGMQEHSGRYADFAGYLAAHGFGVLTYDHLGHGKTARSGDELGFFTLNAPKEEVINDALSMTALLENRFPGIPHFVLGHSMGSFITRCLLARASTRFKGAVIVGTGGRIGGAGLARVLLGFLPPRGRSKFINNTFSNVNNRPFRNEGNDRGTNWLSVNRANREAFLRDKLNGVPFTNNGFHTLLSLVDEATNRQWAKSISREFPFLFVSGADDPIGNFGKGVRQTADYLKKDGFQDVELILYPGMRHEILNELVKEDVYAVILQWLIKKSAD